MSDGYVKEGSYQDILSDGKRTLRIWQEGRTESGTPTLTPIDVAPVVNWQPIETAPKDGTDILGHCKGEEEDDHVFVVVYWSNEFNRFLDSLEEELISSRCIPVTEYTHWQPLPPPPEEVG